MNDIKQTDNILLEQYKLLVNSYENSQQQRINLNNVFVFLYSAIITLYNFLTGDATYLSQRHVSYSVFMIGIITGIFWVNIIRQGVISGDNKRRLISEIEDRMPIRVFTTHASEEEDIHKEKLFHPGYRELALPLFMIAVLAINFFLFIFE